MTNGRVLAPALIHQNEQIKDLQQSLLQVDDNGERLEKKDDSLSQSPDKDNNISKHEETQRHKLEDSWNDFSAIDSRLRNINKLTYEAKTTIREFEAHLVAFKAIGYTEPYQRDFDKASDTNDTGIFRHFSSRLDNDDVKNLHPGDENQMGVWSQEV